jgi:hypothetical protein
MFDKFAFIGIVLSVAIVLYLMVGDTELNLCILITIIKTVPMIDKIM